MWHHSIIFPLLTTVTKAAMSTPDRDSQYEAIRLTNSLLFRHSQIQGVERSSSWTETGISTILQKWRKLTLIHLDAYHKPYQYRTFIVEEDLTAQGTELLRSSTPGSAIIIFQYPATPGTCLNHLERTHVFIALQHQPRSVLAGGTRSIEQQH